MMKKPIPSDCPDRLRATPDDPIPAAIRWCPVGIPEYLTPYQTAAKAIFIRANGGPAYYKATGLVRGGD